MKKIIVILVTIVSIAMMSGCGKNKEIVSQSDTESVNSVDSVQMDEREVTTESEEISSDTNNETQNLEQNKDEGVSSEMNNSENQGEDDANYYEVATSLPKTEVEAFATSVRKMILDKDWNGLSDKIGYPINIGGTNYQSKDDLLLADLDSIVTEQFVAAIESESCQNMFCNWQGIMLASGEIWIGEVLNDDFSSQGLKIIAINIK